MYNYIDLKLIDLDNFDLLLKLSRKATKQAPKKNKRVFGKSISSRPDYINDRREFGHWEIDTVIGVKDLNEPVLLTLTERLTRYELIIKIHGKNEQAVSKALEQLVHREHPEEIFKSITSDNGSEFSTLPEALSTGAEVYFTHSYSSLERGTNENHNGMIRRFIPKGTRLSNVCSERIRDIDIWMNKYPSKILRYYTPLQQFLQENKYLQMT